ncbi:zinc finger protein DPF3 isoform X2 [Aphidius gifuensis]|uniref:zinc finger protein DPF3 isoform X2 n=1 Tax=Aphidius gifuensis TaxID=684658 RepID=UPI001CDC6F30|nr:zinc finger protein DPF3 isoform X2 [Aphidius gifuensis]
MTAVSTLPSSQSIIQVVNEANLNKIESFLNDTAYREAIENSSTYNTRLCRERRLRMPFLDSQTGVAQNHSNLFMSSRERLPGLLHGQIYTYPSKRWRKKRRQYLMHYLHPKRVGRGDVDDGNEGVDSNIVGINDDSKESSAIKDEHSKDAWYYDEQDIIDMDAFDEPDPDSDYDYEESYSAKRKRRRPRGGGHHPTRSHPPVVDSPAPKRTKGGGRGRKKANYDASTDSDKPFVCDRGTRRGRQSTTAASSTSSPAPVSNANPSTGGAPPQPVQQQQLPPVQTSVAPASPTVSAQKEDLQSMMVGSPSSIATTSPGSHNRNDIIGINSNHQTNCTTTGSGTTITATTTTSSSSSSSPPPPRTTPPTTNEGGGSGKRGGKAAAPSPYCDFCLGDARENKKTGGSEELVSCSDCGRSGHPTCLQFTANMIVSVRKYRWQCIECKCCSICGTSDNDDQLLFCDDCDRGYHMYCLSPPLASPPEGSWSCRLCIAEFHQRD